MQAASKSAAATLAAAQEEVAAKAARIEALSIELETARAAEARQAAEAAKAATLQAELLAMFATAHAKLKGK